jgi:hypothetical protein
VRVDSLREGGAREILKSRNVMVCADYLVTPAKYFLMELFNPNFLLARPILGLRQTMASIIHWN